MLNVDVVGLVLLGFSIIIIVEKFINGVWEFYRVFFNDEFISLLGIDGDIVFIVNGLIEGFYCLLMDGIVVVGLVGSISVDLFFIINYFD